MYVGDLYVFVKDNMLLLGDKYGNFPHLLLGRVGLRKVSVD